MVTIQNTWNFKLNSINNFSLYAEARCKFSNLTFNYSFDSEPIYLEFMMASILCKIWYFCFIIDFFRVCRNYLYMDYRFSQFFLFWNNPTYLPTYNRIWMKLIRAQQIDFANSLFVLVFIALSLIICKPDK